MRKKITENMSIIDIVLVMSEGNPGAMQIVIEMLNDPRGLLDILLCDSLDIRGSKLYGLKNDCCKKNNDKFNRTLMMLRCGIFSDEEIQSNLNLPYSIPFIDDDIEIEGIPPYGKDFGPRDEKWAEFCQKNRESFIQKLNNVLQTPNNSRKA